MPNDRVDAALTLIAAIAGDDDRTRTENELRQFNLAQVDASLSIGGFRGPFKSEPESFRRSLVRAVLLVNIARGNVNPTQQQLASLMTKSTARLELALLQLFPYKPYRGNFEKRKDWATTHFTEPTRHSMTKYMYLVHTLMRDPSKVAECNLNNTTELENLNKLKEKYHAFHKLDTKNKYKTNLMVDFLAQYLSDPNIIRQNIISSTVISQAKHATYYPIGFIMKVPPECIYITSPTDLGIKNRTTDIIGELKKTGSATNLSILTPQEVLAQTGQPAGEFGYNEVVVVGTSPEGKQVSVVGIFVKTDARGDLYIYKGTGQIAGTDTFVDANTEKLLRECSEKFNLPIVAIPDETSPLSNKPWPFASTPQMTAITRRRETVRNRTNTI